MSTRSSRPLDTDRAHAQPPGRGRLDRGDERGGTVILVAFAMVVVLGAAAVAVDVAALFQERRELQNGADAGALAVARDCADGDCGAYLSTADRFGDANAGDLAAVDDATIDTVARTATVDASTSDATGGTILPHYFAKIFGISGTTVRASATAQWGPLVYGPSLPLVLSMCEFDEAVGTPMQLPSDPVTIIFHDGNAEGCDGPAPGGLDLPGGFGWVDTSGCEATYSVDDGGVWAGSSTGANPPSGCTASNFPLGDLYPDPPLLFPIFDGETRNEGAYGEFHLIGYAAFELYGYRLQPGNTFTAGTAGCVGPGLSADQVCITGKFVDYYPVDAEMGGPAIRDFGVRTVKLIR